MNLIFAGNLHTGGGVQVAASFIAELVNEKPKELKGIDLCISTAVYNELKRLLVDCSFFNQVRVADYKGLNKPEDVRVEIEYQRCFVIFGPIYYSLNAKYYIVGFAQPWIAYNKNDVYKKLSYIQRSKNLIKFSIQDYLFRRYKHLVVEHKHVKDALIKKGYSMPISVVSNSYAAIYNYPEHWSTLDFPVFKVPGFILGFVGRAYPHKNLKILIQVSQILISHYQMKVNFIFTLSQEEMVSLGFDKLPNFYSTGPISLTQCPAFYKQIDALIFPSQLECFSATPLEAMKMQKPVIASNYPFLSKICNEAATYFDANDSNDIAKSIYMLMTMPDQVAKQVEVGSRIVARVPTSKQRALAYFKLLTE